MEAKQNRNTLTNYIDIQVYDIKAAKRDHVYPPRSVLTLTTSVTNIIVSILPQLTSICKFNTWLD